mmetsp:Transcript_10893/g.25096  ORF Transcript_10893/g.25096 Transcript_10893/m.25096 type:complete len:276 (+) Transcript_10893:219-1046(+)
MYVGRYSPLYTPPQTPDHAGTRRKAQSQCIPRTGARQTSIRPLDHAFSAALHRVGEPRVAPRREPNSSLAELVADPTLPQPQIAIAAGAALVRVPLDRRRIDERRRAVRQQVLKDLKLGALDVHLEEDLVFAAEARREPRSKIDRPHAHRTLVLCLPTTASPSAPSAAFASVERHAVHLQRACCHVIEDTALDRRPGAGQLHVRLHGSLLHPRGGMLKTTSGKPRKNRTQRALEVRVHLKGVNGRVGCVRPPQQSLLKPGERLAVVGSKVNEHAI